ncbi:MOSC domain-containing protein [Larkinella rosea]|uniref:MOSC domain-containing protein n=1 Tax=Larkinella rosea TaxID=2025312 RepID=A0A3P1C2W1_9BACT|nr:MOSC domain-containing protein [Larkinella rosea]RRB07436.1 MOSC domain-containing protein [Larkinella rosea]
MEVQLKKLLETFPRAGRVEWIGIRPVRKEPLTIVEEVEVSEKEGMVGDHYSGRSGNRHVTLLQAEHLPVVAGLTGRSFIDPVLLRRNIIVSGLNLLALKDHQIQIGEAVILEITGLCHPCSRMETNLGPGGYNAMRGHGGLTARVIRGGIIRLSDAVTVVSTAKPRPND